MYCAMCSSWTCKVIIKNHKYLATLTLLTLMLDFEYVLAPEFYSESLNDFILVFLMMFLLCMQMVSNV